MLRYLTSVSVNSIPVINGSAVEMTERPHELCNVFQELWQELSRIVTTYKSNPCPAIENDPHYAAVFSDPFGTDALINRSTHRSSALRSAPESELRPNSFKAGSAFVR